MTNLPFHYEDIQWSEELLESLNGLLKDSDASAEKEMIKQFLQKTSDVFRFVVIGTSSVGKTSLLQKLFGKEVIADVHPTKKICEYRYGEQKGEFQTDASTIRYFLPVSILKGIAVVDMPGVEQMKTEAEKEALNRQLQKSDVLLVVFSASAVGAAYIWDLLEELEPGKFVFVLTDSGQGTEAQKNGSLQKLENYMEDAGIQAEIFQADHLEEMRHYINEKLIGENPGLEKERENILRLSEMLDKLAESFSLRKKQYESDLEVSKRIDREMDVFFADSGELAEVLKENLKKDIDTEIQAYEDEIIARLEPEKIRERFPGGYKEFLDYLNFVSESYRNKMTEQVNGKTQNCVQEYMSGLEQVFDKATGYFRERESMLTFEDKFYGSLAKSRQYVTGKTQDSLQEVKHYYHSLSEASQELFFRLWSARERYDKKVSRAGKIGAAAGAIAGTGGVGLAMTAVGSAITGTAGAGAATTGAAAVVSGVASSVSSAITAQFVTTAAVILWPVVAVAGAVAISKLAKKIASAKGMDEMKTCVREAVMEFRQDVAGTKKQMTAQIMDTIDEIFRREREAADKTFSDFRMSVNIDGKNIPLLEEKLERARVLMEKIGQIDQAHRRDRDKVLQDG